MISSKKSPESGNALIRRIQRYAQASTIFRPSNSAGDVADNAVQRSTVAPTKAAFLTGPSTLPHGRTVDTQGMGSMPIMANSFPEPFSPMVEPATPSAAAAIEHVEQIQRSSEPQVFTNPPAVSTPPMQPQPPVVTPVITDTPSTANVVQAAPEPETAVSDSDWNRLQRIIKGHESKQPDNQPSAASPPVQRSETPAETAPPPAPTPAAPADTIQRAIDTAESNQAPAAPKKAPLESIWPVQQVQSETAVTSDEPMVMRQPDTPISTEPVQSADEVETIRRKLGDVSATQHSDSSVELHLPRRPRPTPIQAKPANEDPNKAFWDRMRKVEGKAPETVQRTVETEIGPLPADMWELLGETPPESPMETGETVTTGETVETVTTSGESTPPIQPKREEADVASSPSATEETEIPSFLADAATTAPNPPDTVQRAIAAAESPEIIPDTTQITEIPSFLADAATTAPNPPDTVQRAIAAAESPKIIPDTTQIAASTESTSPPVQRKETTTPSTPSVSASSTSLNSESTAASTDTEATIAVEAASPTPAASPTEASIQRSIGSPIDTESDSTPEQQDATSSTSQSTPRTATPTVSIPTESTSNQSADIQRSIQAAEASPTPNQETQTPPSTATTPTTTPITSANKPLQPMRSDSAKPSLPKKPSTSSRAESNAQEFSSVDTTSGDVGESVQRATTTLENESSSFVSHTVDLNAETGPLPTLADDWDGGETAVSPSSQSPDTSNAIQRAIAAAEAPPATDEPTVSKSERPLAAPPIIQMKRSAIAEDSPQANLSQESAPQASPLETPSSTATETSVTTPEASSTTSEFSTPDAIQRAIATAETTPATPSVQSETAVTPTTTANTSPDAIQRGIAAAETTPATPSVQSETAVTPPTIATTSTDAIQRAIATAETTPATPSIQSETAVTPPTAATTSPDAIQRAIVAAKTPPATPSVQSETAVDTPIAKAKIPTPDTIQRAIAATETTASNPFTVYHSQATTHLPQTAVPHAIAAAEMAPSMKATTPVIQRAQTSPQTSVTPSTSFVQDSEWQGHTETSTSAPLSTGVATPPPPTTTQTATPSLMRAISAAESPPEQTKAAHQWPDISPMAANPTTAAQSKNNIQRVAANEPSSNFQEYEADSVSEIESQESENEDSPVDVDKLANEVYSQLRKRLAIEWERGRGKR